MAITFTGGPSSLLCGPNYSPEMRNELKLLMDIVSITPFDKKLRLLRGNLTT